MYFTIILNHDNKQFKKVLKQYNINYKYDCRCIDDITFYEYVFEKKYKLNIKIIMQLLSIDKVNLICRCNSHVTLSNFDKHRKSIKHLGFINPL